jgi:hypothetical protein
MGSIMNKELIAVKNREHWDIILDVSLSEGKELKTEEVINIVKDKYGFPPDTSFVVEGIELFALIDNMETVNPGNECKV